jgi:hypothetical protein
VKAIGAKVRVDEVTRPMTAEWANDLQRSGLTKRYVVNMISHVAQIFETLFEGEMLGPVVQLPGGYRQE